jgi:hypothetical protein
VAAKRKKSGKTNTRKKAAVARGKKSAAFKTSSTHHDYESEIVDTVGDMLGDVKSILKWLNQDDDNAAPTERISKRINVLISEFNQGSSVQATHDKRIENLLYGIAGVDHLYKIHGQNPSTPVSKPTKKDHEPRVVELFTTINSICRDIFRMLDSTAVLPTQPGPGHYDHLAIYALAEDTRTVVGKIWDYLQAYHPAPQWILSK